MDDKHGKTSKRHRASKAELERRHRTAEDMLSVGISHGDVVRQLADKYEISERQAENYVRFVYARWRRMAPPDDGSRRDQLIKMAHATFTGALKEQDFRAANQSTTILIRLYGVGASPAHDVLANLPQDRDRFPGDRNYQILVAMRDQLARQGSAGDIKAAGEAARISGLLAELYGLNKGPVTSEQEARAVAAAKRAVVNAKYFGTTDPQVTTGRVDDFAQEQEKPREDQEP